MFLNIQPIMVYSYTQSSLDGIYLYVDSTALTTFKTLRFRDCNPTTASAAIANGPTAAFEATFTGYDAEHFHLQPTAGVVRLIANSGASAVGPPAVLAGLVVNLISLDTNSLAFTQVTTITATFAPSPAGYRQMPATSFIMYAGVKQGDMGIIEHLPATNTIMQRIIPAYKYTATANVAITDVRSVIENGAIKYLVVAYIGFGELAMTTVTTAYFRVYSPPANNPAPTTVVCGANSIAGCKTCGNGTNMNPNKCEVCADGQGESFFTFIIWQV